MLVQHGAVRDEHNVDLVFGDGLECCFEAFEGAAGVGADAPIEAC